MQQKAAWTALLNTENFANKHHQIKRHPTIVVCDYFPYMTYKTLPTTKQAEGLVVFWDSKAALMAITKGHSSITHVIISGL